MKMNHVRRHHDPRGESRLRRERGALLPLRVGWGPSEFTGWGQGAGRRVPPRSSRSHMQLRAEEISRIIQKQIASYDKTVEVMETGTVLTVGDGIARVYGLDSAMAGELVEFPGGLMGMVLNLDADSVGIALMGSDARDPRRRHGQAHRPHLRRAGRRRRWSAASSTRSASRSTARARSRPRPARASR